MITASHNPEEDNGLKLIDPSGEMLATDWEPLATLIVNAASDDLLGVIGSIQDKTSGDCYSVPQAKRICSDEPHVCFARDTRYRNLKL